VVRGVWGGGLCIGVTPTCTVCSSRVGTFQTCRAPQVCLPTCPCYVWSHPLHAPRGRLEGYMYL
jgi:hypothetical protein